LTLLFRINSVLNTPQILGGRITEMMKSHHKELAKVINHAYFLIGQLASKREFLCNIILLIFHSFQNHFITYDQIYTALVCTIGH
jgi:hypothetical protein